MSLQRVQTSNQLMQADTVHHRAVGPSPADVGTERLRGQWQPQQQLQRHPDGPFLRPPLLLPPESRDIAHIHHLICMHCCTGFVQLQQAHRPQGVLQAQGLQGAADAWLRQEDNRVACAGADACMAAAGQSPWLP